MTIADYEFRLPPWAESLRPHQTDAIEQIVSKFENRRIVMLDAPTGAGKTLIGDIVAQVLRLRYRFPSSLYLCTTKTLQDQFTHDFPHARLIKGRANYPTYDDQAAFRVHGGRHLDASMCTKQRITAQDLPFCGQCEFEDPDSRLSETMTWEEEDAWWGLHCHHCHPWQACPYEVAKDNALAAQTAVANTSYYLTETNYVGKFSSQYRITDLANLTGRIPFHLVTIDEADTLESALMSNINHEVSPRSLARIREVNNTLAEGPAKVTKPEVWVEWLREVAQVANSKLIDLGSWQPLPGMEPDLRKKRDLEFWSGLASKSLLVANQVEANPEGWVMQGRQTSFTWKPVTVAPYAHEALWDRAPRWLLMSATLVSADQMAADLGLAPHEWDSVEVGSGFPPERRPIKVRPVANMTYKTKDEEYPKMAAEVARILDIHARERVLIHTVSYELADFLMGELMDQFGDRLVTYSDAGDRENALETYRNRPSAVMVASSLDRGIDLKDELCRVVIIAKVPFPNLKDAQVEKRFYGTPDGRSWYSTMTVRSMVQMTGRGMRHKDDYCVTYVLDSQFSSNIWKNEGSRSKIPKWWKEAIVWEAPQRSA